jgi:hypothetical protein
MSGISDGGGSVHSTATINAQTYGPTSEQSGSSGSSECLKSLARRYILDPGTRVDIVRMESCGRGRLKVMVTLEVSDSEAK